MKYDSIFDVIGHIMVGPSSSHTAGACRIAYVTYQLLGDIPTQAEIILLGSFSETYKGHGTDKAIVAGLLGFKPDDERIRKAFFFAEEKGMKFKIKKGDLGGDFHPNSVLLHVKKGSKKIEVIGSSIGGGNIIIIEIDGYEAGFNTDLPTLVVVHKDLPGIISKITSVIAKHKINIDSMKLTKNIRKREALTWIEINSTISEELSSEIEKLENVKLVRVLNV
ncbi:MAG: L-serine ammonia-lyase, iron-sulfur-dependent subunit beta [Candidatus Heimdallarchaeum endolithica]|uniref:L-serine ammonia-lyase, iron-sulfur-dependent subunit beta n=1 Tax=Candidatus Heimdallarchaeum endolithica TaxID=2876572 RepID=A0A9Y1FPF7_9ARCH|nr:MAG: L-serine ammonia-lyase, iron-sulfur-dependent subunit beta [Candidatus Heimdallarchaeum endolithica]